MPLGVAITLGVIFAVAATIALYVAVFPESKKDKLPKFFKTVRNLLSLDYLLIAKIAKFIYVLSTMMCIFCGFFSLFGKIDLGVRDMYSGGLGLIYLIFGPIICRLIYEAFMMFIILVENTTNINGKIPGMNISNMTSSERNQYDGMDTMYQEQYYDPAYYQGQYADPNGQYADPNYQGQYVDPNYQGQYADPNYQGQYADPNYQGQYVDPGYQGQYVDPGYQGQYTAPQQDQPAADVNAQAPAGDNQPVNNQ